MRQNFIRIKGKKYDSSMKMRNPKFGNTEKPKFPALADKIIGLSDIILEIMDARFIKETRNFELEEQINKQKKKIIYVFNKSDLIDLRKVKNEGGIEELSPKVFVSCKTRKGVKELRNKIKITSYHVLNRVDTALGKITVGIIGYPNTGKSSIINVLVGKPSAGIGADAGFTKGIQKVNLTADIVLLDSPGVIPSKEYSSSDLSAFSKHAKVGARSYSQVSNPEIVVSNLIKEFSTIIERFYSINAGGDVETLIEELGRKEDFLKKGMKLTKTKLQD